MVCSLCFHLLAAGRRRLRRALAASASETKNDKGLPYRTHELNRTSGGFGASKEVMLFEGEWELRIAYVNFDWGHLSDSVVSNKLTTQIAFPAVRGEVCMGESQARTCSRCVEMAWRMRIWSLNDSDV